MTDKHTPGPWMAEEHIVYAANHAVAYTDAWDDHEHEIEEYANAEFIARAVNSYELMLEALRDFVATELDANGECLYCGKAATEHTPGCNVIAAVAAIAAATGEDA